MKYVISLSLHRCTAHTTALLKMNEGWGWAGVAVLYAIV